MKTHTFRNTSNTQPAWDQYASDNPELAQKYLAAAKRKIMYGIDIFKSSPSSTRATEPLADSAELENVADCKKEVKRWYCVVM